MTNENVQQSKTDSKLDALAKKLEILDNKVDKLAFRICDIRAKMEMLDLLFEQNKLNTAWYP
jgi:hypothetical protein